jgi:hypothetical protein
MTVSLKQHKANQQNALKSTGPKSEAGKSVVAGNAAKHGILSDRLTLPDECEQEYQSLFDGLCRSLCPVGVLELVLVEKISINLWRQRRLVRAEQAGIELGRQAKQVADQVSEELGIGIYSSHRVTVDDLESVDAEHMEWCEGVIVEYEQLPPESLDDWMQLREAAPRIHEQLVTDAHNDKLTVDDYLNEHDESLKDYLGELVRYCREQTLKTVRFPIVQAVAVLVKAQRAIPSAEVREKLGRYQTMLDNSLYKDLKALREAQQWRMASIEVTDEAETINAASGG